MPQQKKVALVTIDCFETGAAVQQMGELLGEDLVVIVGSDTARTTSMIGGGTKLIRQSGFRFMLYMLLNFKAYETICRVLRLLQGRNAPTKTVRAWCEDNGVPYIACRNVNSADTRDKLRKIGVSHILIYGFDQFIRSALIEEYDGRIANVHPSSLPNYKGPFPVFWAFLKGETRTGVSLHRIVDETIDTGPVLRRIEVALDPSSDALSCGRMVSNAGVIMVFNALRNGAFGEPGTPQGFGSYFTYPTREEMKQLDRSRRVFSVSSFLSEVLQGKRSRAAELT